jgi:hypothetical protein
VNSEELELSLRSEFENYLKSFRAELRQEAAELQKRIAEAFEAYAARLDGEQGFDEAFRSTVTEHLRLARDEGAKLAANALAEAEQMDRESGTVTDNHSSMRDAIAEISSQTSQSAILTSLITHAAAFAPRGAFFIIKNDQLAGWKVFGNGVDTAENAVREIHIPAASDTILGRAVGSMSTVDSAYGAHSADQSFLEPLNFGHPDKMYAIPLVARGRGVAVMYVDHGATGGRVNVEALESLVRVAALTVELLAASQTAQAEGRQEGAANFEQAHHEPAAEVQAAPAEMHHEPAPPAEEHYEQPQPVEHTTDFAFGGHDASENAFDAAPEFSEEAAVDEQVTEEFEAPAEEPEVETFRPEAPEPETGGAMVFDSGGSIEPASMDSSPSPFETTAQPEPATVGAMAGVMPERSIEVSPQSAGRPRLSDRNVDLPIDVAEDERRLHNDARRFARLLVSEIKLYNEKKVQEGRQANDLYERLREAIDRSREMYDRRVQPPVAAKFDYFHYELVNALADGNVERLGTSYPGSSV